MIAGHGLPEKKRHDQLPLLPVLFALHPRESIAEAILCGVHRSADGLSGRPKDLGVAEDLTVKFGSDGDDVHPSIFCEWGGRAKDDEVPMLSVEFPHAGNGVAKKLNIPARGPEARNGGNGVCRRLNVVHRKCEAAAVACAPPRY